MITTELETVTPATAKKWLGKMINNRPLSEIKSLEYAVAMDEGNWVINGETIKFTDEDKLFDGQHRLQACILADKPFKTYVIRGISDKKAFATVDVGRARTHGDIFSIAGYKNSNVVSGAGYLIFLIKSNMISINGVKNRRYSAKEIASSKLLQSLKVKPVKANRITKEDLLTYCEPIKERLIESCRFAERFRGKGMLKLLTPAQCGSMHFLMREKAADEADRFIIDLYEGAGLRTDDAVYRLRDRLLANSISPNKLTREAVLFLVIKAWGKRRNGEKVGALKIVDGEAFPKII